MRNLKLTIPYLFALLAVAMLLSLCIGRYPLSLREVARILATTSPLGATGDTTDKPWIVVEIVRMPRVLLTVLCGMNLGLAGAAMQGVFRNPLVGPEVCGVSAGASFGGVLAIMLGLSSFGTVSLAFLFGLGALVTAFGLAKVSNKTSILALVLSGVIIGSFCSALVGLAQYVADPQNKLPAITYWLLGSFAGATYSKVGIVAAVTVVAGPLLLGLSWRINLLSLGETDARSLGVNTDLLRWTIVTLVSLLVAAQVSVSGGVGWIGLTMPHFARMLIGPDHGRLLPVSALLGGIYLLAMDDLARTATNQEIPIGLLTAMVGAPIFAMLFRKQQGKGWGHE